MTAFADHPMITHLCTQTDALLSTVRGLDDAAVRSVSLLPDWTRAHVLTHLARNADALANVAGSGARGEITPMYASAAQRDADVDAGAGRSASDLEADVESSAERLLSVLATVAPEHLDLEVSTGRGRVITVSQVPWVRTREVVYHHVDLGLGYTFTDVPDALLRKGLSECPPRLAGASPGARIVCAFADGSQEEVLVGDGAVSVRGSAAEALGWLTGRTNGASLVVDGDTLPSLPSWG